MGQDPSAAGSPDDRLQAMQRVFRAGALQETSNPGRILTYLVGETVAGRADRIKAVTVAQDVLGRGADFDPSTDSSVRVEMKRLRDLLDHYYATTGRDDPLVISIAKGSYVPQFAASGTGTGAPRRRASVWPRVGIGVAAAALVGAVLVFTGLRSQPDLGEGDPKVQIVLEGQSPELVSVGVRIEAIMTRFHNLAVFPVTAVPSVEPHYELRLAVTTASDGEALSVQLVHVPTLEIVRSFTGGGVEAGPEVTNWLAGILARNGALELDFIGRGEVHGDFECTILTEAYFRGQSDARHLAARTCIEDRLAAGSRNARVYIDQTLIMREQYTDRRNLREGEDPLEVALGAGRNAIAADPFDANAFYARMTVLFVAGATDQAVAAGEQALALNPLDPEIMSGFAARLNVLGGHGEALALLDRANAIRPGTAAWQDYARFLAHFGLGDMEAAIRATGPLRGSGNTLYIAALAIASAEVGDLEEAQRLKAELLASEPDLRDMYARRNYAPDLTERLLKALGGID